MRKAIAPIMIICILLLATAPGLLFAQQDAEKEEPEYKSEMETMALMVKSMIDFSHRVDKAESTEEVITACTRLSKNLEMLGPKMKELTTEHPDWDSNPPEEVREPMSRYLDALVIYSKALEKVVTYVQNNPENEELQRAFKELQGAISEMNA